MIKEENIYQIGRLGKTHGVRGEISFLFDDDVFDRVDADYLILKVDGILVPLSRNTVLKATPMPSSSSKTLIPKNGLAN